MGTNYYARHNCCDACGRYDELHIGKSSSGWCFALHVYPELGINNLDDWKARLVGRKVFDEYDNRRSIYDLIAVITERAHKGPDIPVGYVSRDDFHAKNHSADGPNGLMRHALGHNCVGHGEGTWDYIVGEFC